jgi:hypothetical protein
MLDIPVPIFRQSHIPPADHGPTIWLFSHITGGGLGTRGDSQSVADQASVFLPKKGGIEVSQKNGGLGGLYHSA